MRGGKGISGIALYFEGALEGPRKAKVTVTRLATRTGTPSRRPGSNRHSLTALTASSSRPNRVSIDRVTVADDTLPSGSTMHRRMTVP